MQQHCDIFCCTLHCGTLVYSQVSDTFQGRLTCVTLCIQVARNLHLLGGACVPEPLAPLVLWCQRALDLDAWHAGEVTLQDMMSAIKDSWRCLHQLACTR